MALPNATRDISAFFNGIFELFHWVSTTRAISKWSIILLTATCFVHLMLKVMHLWDDMPRLYYKESTLSKHLLKTIPILNQPYIAPIWAYGGHAQTLLSMVLPQTKAGIRLFREYLQVSNDGIVALDWALPLPSMDGTESIGESAEILPDVEQSIPTIIFIPGMTGSLNLIIGACEMAFLQGFRPVIFHSRGTAGAPLTSPHLLSFGDPSDFREAVKYIHEKWLHSHIAAIGYGTGNALLFSYLGEYGSSTNLCSAVAISPIWNMRTLYESCPQPYCWLESNVIKSRIRSHAVKFPKMIDMAAAVRSVTLNELCEQVYFPMYNYSSTEEFWDKNNPLRDVDDIAVPLLVIQSINDPIMANISVPYDLFRAYPNFFLVTTSLGGHCAFFETDSTKSWAMRLSLEYLLAVIDFIENDYKE